MLIHRFPGEDVRLGICLNRISVLADDYVVQPAGATGESVLLGGALFLFFHRVAQLPPVFTGDNPLLSLALAGTVLLQYSHEFLQLLFTDRHYSRLFFRNNAVGIQIHIYHLLNWFSGSLNMLRCGTSRIGAIGLAMHR